MEQKKQEEERGKNSILTNLKRERRERRGPKNDGGWMDGFAF
jgi:hypothetical protein